MLGVAIIGCGLVGTRRAAALGAGGRLVACADTDEARAQRLAGPADARTFTDWREAIALPQVDLVIVATRHDTLREIAQAAVEAGKHVLVEKPGARSPQELAPLIAAAEVASVRVRVGFNHRYHRAVRKACEMVRSGAIGELMYLRARYGHGGRVGYEQEWRGDPAVSGGGELIDQGPHLIDLARLLLGDFTDVRGFAHTYYWDMPVEDNGFLLLRTADDKVAFLHASCTEWKNLFSLEVYGRSGKLEVSGLGGSYGVESLTWYRMLPGMGPPETTRWEFPMADDSWAVEMEEFYRDIQTGRSPSASLADAQACLSIIQSIYRESGLDHRP
jgi:predicted dehydrogenase